VIGPVEECTQGKPTLVNGKYEGGLFFERHERAESVANTERAYPLSITYQMARQMHAPALGNKVYDGQEDENLEVRKDLMKVSSFGVYGTFSHLITYRWEPCVLCEDYGKDLLTCKTDFTKDQS
jgi:hypothetical protein